MSSKAGLDMKTSIKQFREYLESLETYELMVSYDCSGKHKLFGKKLQEYLENELKAKRINESLYKVPKTLDKQGIIKLAEDLKKKFIKIITEEYADEGKTKVCFIIPNGNLLKTLVIIKE